MSALVLVRSALLLAGATVLLTTASDAAPTAKPIPPAAPKLEAVAETHLLMEGLAEPNFRGLERHLKEKPADANSWGFARGQALLIAETGNLLLLRPPHNEGEKAWMEQAVELREAASVLARASGKRDYEGGRAGLVTVAHVCNHCHKIFRVDHRLTPFAPADDRAEVGVLP